VQSFDDAHLLRARPRARRRAGARRAGGGRAAFDTFNLDLMYALPGQTLAELQQDLRHCAGASQPPHLSIYHLTIEPNTASPTARPRVPDDDLASDMLDRSPRDRAAGLQRYEVSAFARPGHRCRTT
jgi:coproporphyrinogen III oxidase-like Fe-S oxidoreductase